MLWLFKPQAGGAPEAMERTASPPPAAGWSGWRKVERMAQGGADGANPSQLLTPPRHPAPGIAREHRRHIAMGKSGEIAAAP